MIFFPPSIMMPGMAIRVKLQFPLLEQTLQVLSLIDPNGPTTITDSLLIVQFYSFRTIQLGQFVVSSYPSLSLSLSLWLLFVFSLLFCGGSEVCLSPESFKNKVGHLVAVLMTMMF